MKHLRNGSPKSPQFQAEPGSRTRSKAPSFVGCRFETGMAFSRRRIHYSVGGDLLEREKLVPKKFLTMEEEAKVTGDMRELYDRILPSRESDQRRADFVQKLDRILNEKWPGNDIRVHMFGSSGNMLCTNDSDDGMQNVVCVPHAKVPIVKFWDPEIHLACDMNVNNTLALENTRMIKTYVQLDARVRPLAMIIKYWTKRRILNDAAKKAKSTVDGKYDGFNDDLDALRGIGESNKETLGELLFQFFRRYGHDVDFEREVISVREGETISKEAKKWHLMQNNRLCIEEPFNIERNLGNTADDISFRGIHLELRRAFDLVAKGKTDECFDHYLFPPTEERVYEKPAPKPPPVLSRSRSQSQSSRGKAGHGNRGGRHYSSGSKNRRASSAAATNKYPLPPNNPAAYSVDPSLNNEQFINAQFEQLKLHRQLFDEMQTLQRQEYELRLKQAQNQLQAEYELQATGQAPPTGPHTAREARRLQAAAQVPLSAPLRGSPQFPPYMYPQVPGTPQNVHTQPSSPSLRSAQLDLRRSMHRSNVTDGSSSGSIRSHSQPARSMPLNLPARNVPPLPQNSQQMLHYQNLRHQQHLPHEQVYFPVEGHNGQRFVDVPGFGDPRRHPMQLPFDENITKEYAGYWINDSPPPRSYRDETRMPRMPFAQDQYPRVRGIPPNFDRLRSSSRSPSPSTAIPFRDRAFSLQHSANAPNGRQRLERVAGTIAPSRMTGPIIVNGTDALQMVDCPPMVESSSHTTTISETTSGSDEPTYQTPATGEMESFQNPPFEDDFAIDQAQFLYQGQQMSERFRHPQHDARHFMEPSPRRLSNQAPDAVAHEAVVRQSERKPVNSRGLNIQFGEHDYNRPPAKSKSDQIPPQEPARQSNHVPRIDAQLLPATEGQTEKAQAVPPLLSPVREVRTPSPTHGRRRDDSDMAKASTVKRAYGKMDLRIPSFAEIQAKRSEARLESPGITASSLKPNGNITPKMNGASPFKQTPVTSPVYHMQVPQNTPSSPTSPRSHAALQQVSAWQQQYSKKHRKNKSRHGTEQIFGEAMPVNEAERKGG
ncbi:uncharacterized protein KY384_000487 [Bacidia gigantensis]|uniref:uncharacterized protein n=1 Tax=Bacidia gigantensis TaxID=2732470 RepID=UPI001D052CCD|nr:uncharacterized protein KY384_000487 [Bacidia gigantensis]KAG8525727.1 hypothetical protein KY384_000487 [Bacidia gigantensis]